MTELKPAEAQSGAENQTLRPSRKRPAGLWWAIIAAIAALLFIYFLAASRLVFHGNPSADAVSSQNAALSISIDYAVQGASGIRLGKKNDVCHSGDFIKFSVVSSDNCWLTVFRRDVTGIHPISKNGVLEPRSVVGEKPDITDFTLDTAIGGEIYYAVASRKNFNFETAVRPRLPGKVSGGGRPDSGDNRLTLPEEFAYDYIYVRHEK